MAKFEVPALPYAYNALEPYISEQIMKLHHDKHHVGYTNNLNAAIEKHAEWSGKSIEEILKTYASAPEDIKGALRNHGGGFYNHSLFWQVMSPKKDQQPAGDLLVELTKQFGSVDAFKQQFGDAAKKIFGSGWEWLVIDGGKLALTSTPNQDSPVTQGKTPILGLDIWEHAYYLQYFSDRGSYVDAWWHVVNWDDVTKRFEAEKK
ncbi:MAG: superoxide dismutase [Candidatus Micrarchaeota archaeon]|nr:superoxide dismutase [Candidatus Micrarchaeota archaeon]